MREPDDAFEVLVSLDVPNAGERLALIRHVKRGELWLEGRSEMELTRAPVDDLGAMSIDDRWVIAGPRQGESLQIALSDGGRLEPVVQPEGWLALTPALEDEVWVVVERTTPSGATSRARLRLSPVPDSPDLR